MDAPESGRRSRFRERVLRELRANAPRGWLVAFALAALIHGLAHGAMAACAGFLGESWVGGVSRADPSFGRFSALSPWLLCLLGLAAASIKTVASAFSVYGQRRLAFRVGNGVRKEVTNRILAGGSSERTAATVAAVALRLREVERGVDEGLLTGVRALTQLAPLVVALILLSSQLAFVAILTLAPFAIVLAWARRRFRVGTGRAAALAERLHGAVDELVRHVDLWRTFGAEARVRSALDNAAELAGRAAARADAGRSALSGVNEMLAAAALFVAVVVARRIPTEGGKGLVAFAAVFFLTYKPLRDLGDARGTEERGADALASLDELAALPSEPVASPRTWKIALLEVHGVCVERDGVTTPPTSFRASPGEIVAIVGPTGAGKTSLLRALLGLERGTGSVRYGAEDLSNAGVGPSQRPFAWVPQEPAVVAATLASNVALGISGNERDEGAAARAALELLGARSLVARADEPLDAGGPQLSGGERQWLALARALASDLPVLLLDEPTAGLDAEAQRTVLEALCAVRGERTVILVTHRTEPLAIADRVVRLGDRMPALEVSERPNRLSTN
jgi:ABC-type multidrug transport system fused ATPase/permease subunit